MTRWWALLREFLRELFDFQFSTFLTTRMLPGVYGFGILLAALFTVYLVVLRFRASTAEGVAWLVIGPLLFFGLITALRITLEFVLAVFRVAWYVEQVASHTEVVSKEIPRFGALGTLLFGKSGPPPPPKT
ncbi:MAG: DUF4282 domain-containing protein [Arenimonas sp.]